MLLRDIRDGRVRAVVAYERLRGAPRLAMSRTSRASRFVYLALREDTSEIEIGVAADPAARISDLQTGNAGQLRLLAVMLGGRRLEAALHGRFRAYRTRGEWFMASPEISTEEVVPLGLGTLELGVRP